MTDRTSDDHPKVGYKQPPESTRFRPGQSGNPRGRQKGVRNLATDVRLTLAGPVTLTENGKTRKVSTQEAVLRRLKDKALKGDPRALDRLIDLAQTFGVSTLTESTSEARVGVEDQEILDLYAELVRTRPAAAPASEIVPDQQPKGDLDG